MSEKRKTTSEAFAELRAALDELGAVLWDDHRLALFVFVGGIVVIETLWRAVVL